MPPARSRSAPGDEATPQRVIPWHMGYLQLRDAFRVAVHPGSSSHQATAAGLADVAGHSEPDIRQVLEASILRKFRRIQRALDSTPDFQVEAEEDIKSETSGTLQNLFLALAKVRTDLQKKGVTPSGKGMGQSGEHCFDVMDKRALWGDQADLLA